MTALRVILIPIFSVLDFLLMLTMWVVIIRAVISWVEPNPYNPIVRTLRVLTDPLLRPFQRLQWRLLKRPVAVDLSPLLVVLLIYLLRVFLASLRYALFA